MPGPRFHYRLSCLLPSLGWPVEKLATNGLQDAKLLPFNGLGVSQNRGPPFWVVGGGRMNHNQKLVQLVNIPGIV